MKHAGPATIEALAPLLAKLRRECGDAVEKKPGTFYRKGQSLLHFHEDPAGIFADLKIDGSWTRFPVNHSRDIAILLSAWRRLVGSPRNSGAK